MARTYTVRDGDTLEHIAKQQGVQAGALAADNNLTAGAPLQTGATLTIPQTQQRSAAATPAAQSPVAQPQTATPYTGLSGLSEQTAQNVGKYSQGYQQSANVTAAQEYLNSILNNRPGAYSSQYQSNLDALYNQIMGRKQFSYDLNGDMLYQQYRDQYARMGQQAMQDTMAQAAMLTGGYGSSYASTAGNQAYQQYLQALNDKVPELYRLALDRYNAEGTDLSNKLSITQGMEDAAYGRYRDAVSDWNNERDFANSDYWAKYNADYSDYQTMLNYWNQMAQQENAQWGANRDQAYSQAMAILQTGSMPSSDLLAMAGISAYDANQIMNAYKPKYRSSGSSKKSSGSGGNQNKNQETKVVYVPEKVPRPGTIFTNGAGSILNDILRQYNK